MRFSASICRYWAATIIGAALLLTACSKGRPEDGTVERVTVTERETSVAGVVTIKKKSTTTERVVPPEETARPRSGILTAGDYDDLLNPDLYAAYATKALQAGGSSLPFVDTRARVAVRVVDATGQPVPHARVDIARKGSPLRLVSAADGVVSFYPGFDGVGGQPRVTVSSAAGNASRTLQIGGGRGLQTATVQLPGKGQSVTAMDLVLVLDATGSMDDEMSYLQSELDTIVARLKRETGNLDLRIGLVVYRDEGDDYISRAFPLTANIRSIRAILSEQEANGGGDMPEAVDRALRDADGMQWRPNAAKALLLVADAPPHKEAMQATLNLTQRLRSRGVQIIPVAASGVEDSAQYIMRTMAVLTQGRYVFLTDDSGVGNTHADPDVACYVVTHLDGLIARLLAGIVEGRRIEPHEDEVIRMVGNYDRGRCRNTAQGQQ